MCVLCIDIENNHLFNLDIWLRPPPLPKKNRQYFFAFPLIKSLTKTHFKFPGRHKSEMHWLFLQGGTPKELVTVL